MKRVNIQNDVESRQRIAAASPKPFTERTDERMNLKNEQQDGTSEEVSGARTTQLPQMSRFPRRKEDGRPTGTYKKYRFEETRLGFLLKYEAPVVYGIIMNLTPRAVYPEPKADLIEQVCRASGDPSLRKPKFIATWKNTGTWGFIAGVPNGSRRSGKPIMRKFVRRNWPVLSGRTGRLSGRNSNGCEVCLYNPGGCCKCADVMV